MTDVPDRAAAHRGKAERVRIDSLVSADSPRLNGEVKVHAKQLADSEAELPPILVHRQTMRVIDGAHRILAMKLRGHDEIEVEFFDGNTSDAFVLGVQSNIQHGLPLSLPDRRAAAERILLSHPVWSDREIARTTGLSARTIQELRCATADEQQSHRLGRDGRTRPLSSARGRRLAAEILTNSPNTPLRDIAKQVGISPGTVRDVRKRLERGESPIPESQRGIEVKGPATVARRRGDLADVPEMLDHLARDPTLRMNERGRELVRWLHLHRADPADFGRMINSVPAHSRAIVLDLALAYAAAWESFATELKE